MMNFLDDYGFKIPEIPGWAGFCPQYQAVYDSWTTKPDAARSLIYDTMVRGLVDIELWPRIDIFHFHSAHTNGANEALTNWKLPGTFTATLNGAGLPIFTIDQGFLGDGVQNYIDYNFIPSVNGVNFVRNSASQIIYIRTNIASNKAHGAAGNANNRNCVIYPRYGANQHYAGINSGGNNTGVDVLDARGLWINTRTALGVNKTYQNKIININGVVPSIEVPTVSMLSLAANDDGVATLFRADQVAIHILMDGCSQADVTAISDILNAAMTSLGTNVY